MHGPAPASAHTTRLAHHFLEEMRQRQAACQHMPMASMCGRQGVLIAKSAANAGGNGLLPYAQMNKTRHLAIVKQAGKAVFYRAYGFDRAVQRQRSEEHTSELQSLMRLSYA